LAATLGTPGEIGSDIAHFWWPEDAVVDGNGTLFVADQINHRIQVFDSNLAYVRTMGVTGEPGEAFDHFWNPNGLFIDSANHLYVADQDNNRIQVFDDNGNYLTTIAGAWGTNTSQLRAPTGVAIDSAGNVYVADFTENHRIQKFSRGVFGWQQTNINGFGNRFNRGLTTLEVFGDSLYAGASNWDEGGTIWRSTDAHTWTQVTDPGFGNESASSYPAIIDMVEFNGQLYASTGWGDSTGQLWRSSDGATWQQVVDAGFGDENNGSVAALAVYHNVIYAGTGNSNTGPQIWRSSSGNSSSWNNVVTSGLGCSGCSQVSSLVVFNNDLYAGVESTPPSGLQIWRTSNGSDWNQVGETGFGDTENAGPSGLAIFHGNLFAGTYNKVTGAQIWRSANGSTWSKVIGNGFGDINNFKIESLYTFGANLFAATNNAVTGMEIWCSADGITWRQVNIDGFGDSNNDATLWSSATTAFQDNLYIGTWNWSGNGGELWKFLKPVVWNVNSITDTGDGTLDENEAVTQSITKLLVTFSKDVKLPKATDFALKNTVSSIAINSLTFDSTTNTATLNINGGVKLPAGAYTLTVKNTITATDNNSMGIDFIRHFNISKALAAPLPISPANGALTIDYTPRLDWTTVTQPAGTTFDHYKLQVDRDNTFASPLLDEDLVGITNSEFTFLSDLAPNTTHYWRVQAWNTAGQESVWSVVRNFRTALTAPTLVSPNNAVMVFTLRPTFIWNDNPDASGYTIQISKNDAYTMIVHTANPAEPPYTPVVNLPTDTILHWRVRANGTNGPSAWSESRSIMTGNPPSVPILLAPLNNALVTTYNVVLDWKTSTLTVGTFKHYQIQINDSLNFTTPLVNATTTAGDVLDSDYAAAFTANKKYYWRVRAVSTIGPDDHFSGWSTVWSIRAAMLPPVLTAPINDTQLDNKRPTLEWQDVSDATGYKLVISQYENLSSPLKSVSTVDSLYSFTADLPAKTKLYWRVQATGPNGPSLWSETWHFTTGNPPSVPVLVAPANNTLVTNPAQLLNWNNSVLPTGSTFKHYQIQINNINDFTTPLVNATTTTGQLNDSAYIASFTPDTKYYWRVRAVNSILGVDHFSAWSAVWSVRMAILPPTPITPADGASGVSRAPTLDWSDVSNNTGYTLQVWKAGSTPVLVKTVTLLPDVSTYVFSTNLLPNTAYFWKVQTKAVNGPSLWSERFDFVTGP
jgi:hypothetical protein